MKKLAHIDRGGISEGCRAVRLSVDLRIDYGKLAPFLEMVASSIAPGRTSRNGVVGDAVLVGGTPQAERRRGLVANSRSPDRLNDASGLKGGVLTDGEGNLASTYSRRIKST
jgi:hypothetical protein